MKNISEKIFRENQNENFVFCNGFFENRAGDNEEKYCRGGQATGDNMAHAHCILGT
jgi:hypothetical protein